jgi:DNA-binding transcriptional ArsR family regulator
MSPGHRIRKGSLSRPGKSSPALQLVSYLPGPARCRLDSILGSPSAVRILRVMTLAGVDMSAGEITRRARINRSGGGRVLVRLKRTGLVEVARRERPTLYRINGKHHLARPLTALFRTEADTLEPLVEELREIARSLAPRPVALWIEEEDAGRIPADRVMVVHRNGSVPDLALLEAAVRRHAEVWGVHMQVATLEVEELAGRPSPEEALPVFGRKPEELIDRRAAS